MRKIIIPKSIVNRPDYLGEKFSRPAAWIDLLLIADDNGDLCFTMSSLATRWKWQRRAVRSFLDQLSLNCAITYTMHNSGHSSMHNLTICDYGSYMVRRTDKNTDDCSVQKASPLNHSLSSSNPPAPPYTPTITPPISPSKNSQTKGQDAGANAHEGQAHPPTPFPYPAPFMLSSVERDMCRFGKTTEAIVKRCHLERNLRTFSAEIGMSEADIKDFLDWYCQPTDHNPNEILAEKSGAFDLRYRAERWIKKNKSESSERPSRIEQYTNVAQNFGVLVNELFNPGVAGAADSPADSTDEQ